MNLQISGSDHYVIFSNSHHFLLVCLFVTSISHSKSSLRIVFAHPRRKILVALHADEKKNKCAALHLNRCRIYRFIPVVSLVEAVSIADERSRAQSVNCLVESASGSPSKQWCHIVKINRKTFPT